MQTIICRIDKQQGPTVSHRELYLLNHNGKEYFKSVSVLLSHCSTAEIGTKL